MILSRTGATVQWDDGMGDVCYARGTAVADTLIQQCAAGRGSSVARYVLEDSGAVLRRSIHITSPHLSAPVDYVTLYRRCSDQTTLAPLNSPAGISCPHTTITVSGFSSVQPEVKPDFDGMSR
jgi:hypothetical protein